MGLSITQQINEQVYISDVATLFITQVCQQQVWVVVVLPGQRFLQAKLQADTEIHIGDDIHIEVVKVYRDAAKLRYTADKERYPIERESVRIKRLQTSALK